MAIDTRRSRLPYWSATDDDPDQPTAGSVEATATGGLVYRGLAIGPSVRFPGATREPLAQELDELRSRIRELSSELEALRDAIGSTSVVVLREITKEEAKDEIRGLFASGETLYYSDIAQRLRIGLELAVGLCNELEEAGEIGTDAGADGQPRA